VSLHAADTSGEAAAVQLDAYRRLGPEARVELAARLSEETREVALAGIRQRHPGYSEGEAFSALLRLLMGDERVRSVLPGRPLVDP
jgi:hypothetical protein